MKSDDVAAGITGVGGVVFYERRKQNLLVDFRDRRVVERRGKEQPISPEKRRFSSQVRRYEREPLKIPVCLQMEGNEISGYTSDISPEGLLVFSGIPLQLGTPMALQFSFGENFCYMNVSGQVVHCLSTKGESPDRYEVGIKFSAIRGFENKILASAVQELRQNPATHDKSSLSIFISTDTIAKEGAGLLMRTSRSLEAAPTTLPMQSPIFDRRFSPRLESNLFVRVFPDNVHAHILSLSETGFYLACEKPILSKHLLLSLDLSPVKPNKFIGTSAEIVGPRPGVDNNFFFGVRVSSLSGDYVSQIRDFIFDGYAKIALTLVKTENEDLKIRIEEFFNKDVRQYHRDLSAFALDIEKQNGESINIERMVAIFTNNLLLTADILEKTIANKVQSKKLKKIFRDLVGCWAYKSSIGKIAYEKPRGYPGDYKLFEMIYDNKPISDGIGFYFDKYFLNNTYTVAVRSRKDKMKSILKDFIKNRDSSSVRLLNIACGACKEIRDLFAESFVHGKEIVFTGLDHDAEALEFSRTSLAHLSPNLKIRLLKENVLEIFRNKKYYEVLGKQDIIYILGLSEYLPDRIFKKLVYFLFELLNEKGKLVITYKDKNIQFPALPPDWLCDWDFVKRTEQDLIDVAEGFGAGKYSLKIERESTGCIFFLIVTKT